MQNHDRQIGIEANDIGLVGQADVGLRADRARQQTGGESPGPHGSRVGDLNRCGVEATVRAAGTGDIRPEGIIDRGARQRCAERQPKRLVRHERAAVV